MDEVTVEQLRNQLDRLEARWEDLQARLPAHSIPPAMMMELDNLEDALVETRAQLARATGQAPS